MNSSYAASVPIFAHTNAIMWFDDPGNTLTLDSLNYRYINRIYYCWVGLSADGLLWYHEYHTIGRLQRIKQEHPHVKVVLCVGGAFTDDKLGWVVSMPAYRQNLAMSARYILEQTGLDGLDIAWIPRSPQRGVDFLALLALIRQYVPSHLLTWTVPAEKASLGNSGRGWSQNIDLQQSVNYVDTFNLRAFAFATRSGHQAQLYTMDNDEPSVDLAVQHLRASGVPAHKILLGIPLFALIFWARRGGEYLPYSGGGLDRYNTLPFTGSEEQVDEQAVAVKCFKRGMFASYDSPFTVKMKAAFCMQNGLEGLFHTIASADSTDTERSLIIAGYNGLHNTESPESGNSGMHEE